VSPRAYHVTFMKQRRTLLTMLVACIWIAPGVVRADSNPVVATVGNHKITEKELDAKIKPQIQAMEAKLYDAKKQAIEAMADDYLLSQAAAKEHQSVDEFLKGKAAAKGKVTEADAKKFYDARKDLQTRFPKYNEIKDQLVAALQAQRDGQARAEVLAELRKSEPVNVMIQPPRIEVATAGHPVLGPAEAPVTIVEFSDFQCPFCKRVEPSLKEVRDKYGDKVRLIYMDYPLGMHQNAIGAAQAARCAAAQGKFWPYHDELFADQGKLGPADLKASAKKVGLDSAKFDECYDKGTTRAGVDADKAQGDALGVTGTPAFFINGRPLEGAQPTSAFASVIDDELASAGKKSTQTQAKRN